MCGTLWPWGRGAEAVTVCLQSIGYGVNFHHFSKLSVLKSVDEGKGEESSKEIPVWRRQGSHQQQSSKRRNKL